VPYGSKSPRTVERYSLTCQAFLLERGVKLVMIACNTASANALPALRAASQVTVIGAVDPGADGAVAASRSGHIGVIGTLGTVRSGAYEAALAARRPDLRVTALACPLLVPLAEEGWIDDEVAAAVARRYLTELFRRDPAIDTLVLGCTHYPLLRGVLQETMGSQVVLVDSAESVASEVRRRLTEDRQLAHGPGGSPPRFFVTDAPGPFLDVARRFLGGAIEHLEQATLEASPAW
jgi:glutamate racemase